MLMRFRPQGLIPLKMRRVDLSKADPETLRNTPCSLFDLSATCEGEGTEDPGATASPADTGGAPS